MATNIKGGSAYLPSFVALSLQNGLEYRKTDGRIGIGDDSTMSLRNLVNFCLATPDITRVEILIFWNQTAIADQTQ